ncbi:tripartite tricarboxylate transporter TctB family protein [Pseudonocardia nematodicida]|uniref:Tripartite tricarboxylate transporter TctB family protein n=1 Tax=Pseudonocardia nematodicida TaxID=1206997 RepID=A0ABV1KIS1_9PSEU
MTPVPDIGTTGSTRTITAALPGALLGLLGALVVATALGTWFTGGGETTPGLVPLVTGLLLLGAGCAVAAGDIRSRPGADTAAAGPVAGEVTDVVVVIGSVLVFAAFVGGLGLLLTVPAVVYVLATRLDFRTGRGLAATMAGLLVLVVGAFVLGLRLPLPILPTVP